MSEMMGTMHARSGEEHRTRRNLGTAERWLSAAFGIMTLSTMGKRSALGKVAAATTAGMLLTRSATGHSMLYDRVGVSSARRVEGAGINIDSSITIMRPRHELYEFWRDPANLAIVMRHVESVRQKEGGITHWKIRGPRMLPVSWDARVINEVPDEMIAWESVPGSMVSQSGSVHFTDAGDRGTEVRVRMRYTPERSAVAFAVAKMLNPITETGMAEDLRRLKHTMETGVDITAEGQTSGRVRASKPCCSETEPMRASGATPGAWSDEGGGLT